MFFYPQKCLKTFFTNELFSTFGGWREISHGVYMVEKFSLIPQNVVLKLTINNLKLLKKTLFYMKNVFTKPNGDFNPLPPPNATVSVDVDVLNTVWCAQCNYTRATDYYQIKSNIRLLLELIIAVTAASMI